MDFFLWISFVGTTLILTLTPGPSVLLATANSMKYGKNRAGWTILGDLSANLSQIILASAGLVTLFLSFGEILVIIKWCGVAYLLYMGLSKIFSKSEFKLDGQKKEERSNSKLYAEGFLMSAANPKAIVFFATLFPLFISDAYPFVPQIMILAATFLLLDGICLSLYAQFAMRLKTFLENQKKMHLQNRVVGLLLIFSGLMLSMVKRGS